MKNLQTLCNWHRTVIAYKNRSDLMDGLIGKITEFVTDVSLWGLIAVPILILIELLIY